MSARTRSGVPADIAALNAAATSDGAQEVYVAVRAAGVPEGELFAEGAPWRFAACVIAPARESENASAPPTVLIGDCESPEQVAIACGERPVVAHDAKALGRVPRLAHDTMLGAYLLEPARRAYPFAELCEERGLSANMEDSLAADALLLAALAAWQREQIVERGLEGLLRDVELPLVPVLREMELAGVRLNVARLAEITERVRAEIAELERRIYELAGEEFTIGSPQQLGEILFVKLGLSRKRRGKTGFSTDARVLQAIRYEHEIVPCIERWRELSTLIKTYIDVLPQLVDENSRIHTTFLQAGAQTGRLASPTRTCRTSRSAPSSAARSAAASRPSPAAC